MHRVSLGQLTAIGLSTPEIVYLAADLGCEGVTINPGTIPIDLGGPVSRLDKDPDVRDATARALVDTGVQMDMMEPIGLLPDFALDENRIQLEIFAELGAKLVNIAAMDPDQGRMKDNLAAVCELAASLQVRPVFEFFAAGGGSVPSLAAARALVDSGEFTNLGLTIDTLHLARAGETPADLAKVDPSLVAVVQLADAPAAHPGEDAYLYEALFERKIPGDGELPLVEILALLSPDAILSPEVPLTSLRQSGVPVKECARRVIDATRALDVLAANR